MQFLVRTKRQEEEIKGIEIDKKVSNNPYSQIGSTNGTS
jgi:hypothetical protein